MPWSISNKLISILNHKTECSLYLFLLTATCLVPEGPISSAIFSKGDSMSSSTSQNSLTAYGDHYSTITVETTLSLSPCRLAAVNCTPSPHCHLVTSVATVPHSLATWAWLNVLQSILQSCLFPGQHQHSRGQHTGRSSRPLKSLTGFLL